MKVILEIFTAGAPPMSIVDRKEMCLSALFLDIKRYIDSIFVVIASVALVSVDRVCLDDPMLFRRMLGWVNRRDPCLLFGLFS